MTKKSSDCYLYFHVSYQELLKMTIDREQEIQGLIIEVMSKLLKPDLSEPYQSISFVGLHQMLASISRDEFIEALKKIEGLQYSNGQIQIPSKHFEGK
jgi:hypothetical protein